MNPTTIQKTKHARTVPAHETTRKRLEPTLPKDHDDHRAERVQFDNSLQFGAQVCSDALSGENSGRASSSGEGMEEARKTIPDWQLDKDRSQKEVILEAQSDKRTVHFATLMDICRLKHAE